MRISNIFASLLLATIVLTLHGCGASMSKLTKAVQGNDMVAIKKALKSGGKVNELDDFGRNALHMAVKAKNVKMISYLLQQNANPNIATKYGKYPVVMAAKTGSKEAVKLLLDAGADANQRQSNRHSSLYESASIGNMDIINLLIARGAKVEGVGKSPLVIAAGNGHLDAVKLLIAQGAKIEGAGQSPLIMAAKNGHAGVVELLISKGANIKKVGASSLVAAAGKGEVEIIKILLAADVDPNKPSKKGDFAIVSAGEQNNPEVAMLLLAAGANVNQFALDRTTPLYSAAYKGQTKMVDFLISAGAKVDAYSYKGNTALIIAIDNGKTDVVKSLLAAGADPDLRDNDKKDPYAPVYFAIRSDHESEEIIKYLIAAGANLDAKQGKYHWTTLHYSSNKSWGDKYVELLLQGGANPNIRDNEGDTPLDVASRAGHKKNQRLLRNYGGGINNYKKKSGSSFGKIFATVAIAGIAGSADISASDTARVMSATVNDIWVKDGQGNQLGNMYKQSLQNGEGGRSNNPIVNEMLGTRNQQQSAAAIYNEEMKKYQEIIKQQRQKQQKPSLYQQQLDRIAGQANANNVNKKGPNTLATSSVQTYNPESSSTASYRMNQTQVGNSANRSRTNPNPPRNRNSLSGNSSSSGLADSCASMEVMASQAGKDADKMMRDMGMSDLADMCAKEDTSAAKKKMASGTLYCKSGSLCAKYDFEYASDRKKYLPGCAQVTSCAGGYSDKCSVRNDKVRNGRGTVDWTIFAYNGLVRDSAKNIKCDN